MPYKVEEALVVELAERDFSTRTDRLLGSVCTERVGNDLERIIHMTYLLQVKEAKYDSKYTNYTRYEARKKVWVVSQKCPVQELELGSWVRESPT